MASSPNTQRPTPNTQPQGPNMARFVATALRLLAAREQQGQGEAGATVQAAQSAA